MRRSGEMADRSAERAPFGWAALAAAFAHPTGGVETRPAGRVDATPITYTEGFKIDLVSAEQGSSSCGDQVQQEIRRRKEAEQEPPRTARISAPEIADLVPELRLLAGYDHSYFFIASFIEEHLRFHARQL